MTIINEFLASCEKFPDKVAVIDGDKRVTYSELENAVRMGAGIVNMLTEKERIGILLPTGREFVVSFLAALFARKTPVPLNPLLPRPELSYIIEDAGLDTIVSCHHFREQIDGLAKQVVYMEEIAPYALMSSPPIYNGQPDDIATVLYTSGTTSRPKGVRLTHENILSNLNGCLEAVHFDENDMILGVLPMFHTFALTTTLVLPLKLGATAVYLPRFSAPSVLATIHDYKITAMLAIPSLYRLLLWSKEGNKFDGSSLRLCVCGGEPLTADLTDGFEKAFGVPLLEGYGLTETAPVVSVNAPDALKKGTAGKPLPNVDVKIVDDDGGDVGVGNTGEIWVSGPSIMPGYLNMDDETKNVMAVGGWFKTGDLGILDDEGFLSITGRKKELIISGGENISPHEIEHVLNSHPAVFESAVIGVPDNTRGEVPKAFVQLAEDAKCDAKELRQYCRDKLARFKIPREIELRDELPHTLTGKVLRRALKESE